MLHGPCGPGTNAKCMENGKCAKGFPKPFNPQTRLQSDGYPVYMRLENGIMAPVRSIKNRSFVMDNRWVVPYNPYILLRYRCHVNVEVCSSVNSIKYIFKGPDQANISITESNIPGDGQQLVYDEIKSFEAARYLTQYRRCGIF